MAPVVPDRLPAMLFLAALVHGILIIGVTFNAAAHRISLPMRSRWRSRSSPAPDQQIDRPDEAAYLAQASQEGGGNITEQIRPSAPLESALPADNEGDEDGTALDDAKAHERSADEVLASASASDRQVPIDPRTDPQAQDSIAIAMEAGSELTLPLPQEDKATLPPDRRRPAAAHHLAPTRANPSRRPTWIPGSVVSRQSALRTCLSSASWRT